MARGRPDYDNPDYAVAIQQNDMSLLHVVQSGFNFIDGRGRIVWMDNFSNGLNRWSIASGSGGATPTHKLISNYSYGYHGSIILDPVTNDGFSTMQASGLLPLSDRMGIEAVVKLPTSYGRFTLRLAVVFTATQAKAMEIYIEEVTGDVYIYDGTGYVLLIDNTSPDGIRDNWLSIKLMGNFNTGEYVRLRFGGVDYDLDGYTMQAYASSGLGAFLAILKSLGQDTTHIEPAYVGGVVITADEP